MYRLQHWSVEDVEDDQVGDRWWAVREAGRAIDHLQPLAREPAGLVTTRPAPGDSGSSARNTWTPQFGVEDPQMEAEGLRRRAGLADNNIFCDTPLPSLVFSSSFLGAFAAFFRVPTSFSLLRSPHPPLCSSVNGSASGGAATFLPPSPESLFLHLPHQ